MNSRYISRLALTMAMVWLTVTSGPLRAQSAQIPVSGEDSIRFVRVLETDDFISGINLPGVAFPPRSNTVLTMKGRSNGRLSLSMVDPEVAELDKRGKSIEVADAMNLTLHAATGESYLLSDLGQDINFVSAADKNVSRRSINKSSLRRYGLKKPAGVAIDPVSNTLHVLDSKKPARLVSIIPTDATGDSQTRFSVAQADSLRLKLDKGRSLVGLVFDPQTSSLMTVDAASRELLSIDLSTGALIPVGKFPTSLWQKPAALTMARSLDSTDSNDIWHLFIASLIGPNGQVTEWSIPTAIAGGS